MSGWLWFCILLGIVAMLALVITGLTWDDIRLGDYNDDER